MIKHILAGASLTVLLGFSGLPVLAQKPAPAPAAQQTVGEADLKKFVSVAKKLEAISQERNTLISQTIQKEGLSLERFREIYLTKQNPELKPNKAITNDEQQKYDRTLAQLVTVQKTTQENMGKAVESEGLDVPRFLAILKTIQQTPGLQQKVDQMLKAK